MPSSHKKIHTASLTAILALFAQTTLADNWPEWRGPTGDGVCRETALPTTWSATENVKWKVPLPERGNSTPIIWNERVFVTQAVKERRTLMCFDRKDGKLLWQEGPTWEGLEKTHGTNPYCSASPVTDGERVIAWFGSAGVWCWDLNGKEQWHVDLGKQEHIWGYAASPVIFGDLCIINFGPGVSSFLVALDKKSGKEVWRTATKPPAIVEGPGAPGGSWTTPVIAKFGGRAELVMGMPGAVRGFDPQTGQELWFCNGLNPLVYANPIVAGDYIGGMGGYSGFAIGFKHGGTGDLTPTRLWQEKKNGQRIGSGVAKDGLIYMTNESGLAQCLDPQTGQALWQERPQIKGGRGDSWSSFVLSGDRLYLLNHNSNTVVLKAGRQFEQLGVNDLNDGRAESSLAVSNGELFIRTHRNLWCIAEKK